MLVTEGENVSMPRQKHCCICILLRLSADLICLKQDIVELARIGKYSACNTFPRRKSTFVRGFDLHLV